MENRADVFVFGYDLVQDRDGECVDLQHHWDPAQFRGDLFLLGSTLSTPTGIAHRRDLCLSAGGFNEDVSWDDTGELLKRMARNGATFLFAASTCGRHHFREGAGGSAPMVSGRQVSPAEAGFAAGKPLNHDSYSRPPQSRPVRKVLFASAHSAIDFSNGASVATLDLLKCLGDSGFECQVFCTPKLDFQEDVCFEQIISDLREPYELRPSMCGPHRAQVLYTRRNRVPITVMRVQSTRHMQNSVEENQAVLAFFRKFLESYRPDVMVTYGGDPVTQSMIALARRRDIPVVFALHSLGYREVHCFWNVDYCIVPSEFTRSFYREKIGLAAQTLSYPVDWCRAEVNDRTPSVVTFVNPSKEKGAYAFARIAHELGRRRPDIRFLVVESRGTKGSLAACGIDLDACGNVQVMQNTVDPRQFWRVTKIAMMPSLWWENQPLVAIEAMINGIPVVGSDRGGIPETLGNSGFALPLPDRLTPVSEIRPTAQEVELWIETIIRLWDDTRLYEQESAKARNEAQRWHPDRLRPLYREFFSNVHHQPGPPLIPREPRSGVAGRMDG